MPSTYSPSLRIELIGNGEQAGTWGTTTNNNLGTLIEAAIAGVQPITLTGGDYTLTDYNGLPDESRNAVLMFGGLLAAPCNVIAPSSEKVYIVRNRSNATVTIKTSTGNGIAIANAASEVIFCDGQDFYSATQFNYVDGDLTVTGNVAVGGSVVVGTTVTLGSDMYGNSAIGQWWLPSGNSAQRTSSPINGVLRYNTDSGGFYEGYQNNTWVRFQTYPEGNYTIAYLVAAGGGGSRNGSADASSTGGGSGAGGVIIDNWTATPGTQYAITVGGGGAQGAQGTISQIANVVSCTGGGYGGGNDIGTNAAGSGGSGGGAGFIGTSTGSGISGQGNRGGIYAGGGGGAGAVGGDGSGGAGAGVGGIGKLSTITGASVYYGGGGGGGGSNASGGGAGGLGGGGAGGIADRSNGVNGTANTGGGGGGCGGYSSLGGQGGSGVVILRMPTVNYTGVTTGSPAVTVDGAFTVLRYTSSGSYTT